MVMISDVARLPDAGSAMWRFAAMGTPQRARRPGASMTTAIAGDARLARGAGHQAHARSEPKLKGTDRRVGQDEVVRVREEAVTTRRARDDKRERGLVVEREVRVELHAQLSERAGQDAAVAGAVGAEPGLDSETKPRPAAVRQLRVSRRRKPQAQEDQACHKC